MERMNQERWINAIRCPTAGIVAAATNMKTWPKLPAMWPTTYRQTSFDSRLGRASKLTRRVILKDAWSASRERLFV